MTREEAYGLVRACYGDSRQANYLLEALKHLGLLKFDEPKLEPITAVEAMSIARATPYRPGESELDHTERIIRRLWQYGYKLVLVPE